MTKILFVTSALGGGGAERVLSILALFFANHNYLVETVSLISNRHEYIEEGKIKNTFIGNAQSKLGNKIGRYTKLRKKIHDFKPNIIISFGAEINMYALLANRNKYPILISERNNPNVTPRSAFMRKIRNFLYKDANHIVFQTLEARAYFSKIKDSCCSVIPNPISENLPEYCPTNTEFYIFSVGRLNQQKNFCLLIEAFSKLHKKYANYSLIIAGEGPERESLEKQISLLELEKSVHLIGFTKEVHSLMSKCSMFVLTSNYEGMSNAMLESLAIGAPTICTDCPIGGARMIIQNEKNGLLTPVNDVEALYEAMVRIIENKEFALKLSKNAVLVRQELAVDTIAKKWEKLVEELLRR